VLLGGFSGSPGSHNIEVALDIDMAISMAPGLSQVVIYEAPTNNAVYLADILNSMATNLPLARQLSSSWLQSIPATNASADQIFLEFAAQGQSFFQASGDADAYSGGVRPPADDSYITIVGGTSLLTTGPGGNWQFETVWNWGYTDIGYVGSSGGISTIYPIPSWQTNINMSTNQGSTTMRNIPDVAMVADNIFVIANNGTNFSEAGTSAAAPLWAGFMALVNQQATNSGQPPAGFINPAIYAIGKGPAYNSCFDDITTGNNTNSNTTEFFAVPGYDLCTGWGTPTGGSLLIALANPDGFLITPGRGFTASGPAGGPFNITASNFSLTNSGSASFNWSLINTSSWLNASSSAGTLAAGGNTTVTLSLNSAATKLAAGVYTANVWFTNLTSHAAQIRQFTLQAGQSVVLNGGFENGDFAAWTLNGTTTSGGDYVNGVVNAQSFSGSSDFIHSGTYGTVMGQGDALAYLSQTLPTVPGQQYLLSFWLDATSSGTVQQFVVNWNTNAASKNTIFNQSYSNLFNWTNVQLIVTAAGTSTLLQFGSQNDPYYFGLDDVNAWPIPAPSFLSAAWTNNNIAFTWNSLTGLAYQVQYLTNLTRTNWINLGSSITATNFTATSSDSIGPNPERFYRVVLSP
jgi:subtilase family serine protease